MPPSAITFTYSPVSSMCWERAAATSAIAVACGTPMPSTPRVVQAAPGPDAHEHAHGAGAHQVEPGGVGGAAADDTGTGTSRMNSFRLSGSLRVDTCSAEITVPWMTRMSSPASMAVS